MNATRTLVNSVYEARDWGNVAKAFDALADHYENNPDIGDPSESARLARTVATVYRSGPTRDETAILLSVNMMGAHLRPHGSIIKDRIWPQAAADYSGQAAENVLSIIASMRKFASHSL